jgi:hypothetical protein
MKNVVIPRDGDARPQCLVDPSSVKTSPSMLAIEISDIEIYRQFPGSSQLAPVANAVHVKSGLLAVFPIPCWTINLLHPQFNNAWLS